MFTRLHNFCTTLFALALPLIATAYTPDYYAKSSVLATGHWVKVDVDTTGIYEVSYDQLLEWGFERPGDVKVYGYGGVLPTVQDFTTPYKDDLPPTAAYHTEDGRLLFYGIGVEGATMIDTQTLELTRNTYDTAGHYFLSDVETDYEVPVHAFTSVPTAIYGERNWHYSYEVIEREVQNPGHGGGIFHGKVLEPGESESFTFHVRDFGWNRTTAPVGAVHIQPALNSNVSTLLDVSISGKVPLTKEGITQTPPFVVGTKTGIYSYGDICAKFVASSDSTLQNTHFTITATIPDAFDGKYAAINAAYTVYPRFSSLYKQAELAMVIRDRDNARQSFTIDDADSDVQVWNVTDPTAIYAYPMVYEGDGVARGHLGAEFTTPQSLIAFNPKATHRTPRYAGVVANQDIHSRPTPEYLIITTQTMYPYAEELADIHRAHGRDVLVLTQNDIVNEFGSGSVTPAALRRLVKMYYDRDGGRLGAVLMYGPATYDYRYLTTPTGDALLTFQCEYLRHAYDDSMNYATDHYFGMVLDDIDQENFFYWQAQVPVGRIPADNAVLARQYNTKSKDYLDNPPSAAVALRALKFSDDGDSGKHLTYSEQVCSLLCQNPNITIFRADNLLYPIANKSNPEAKKIIDNSLKRGVNFFYYTGHGGSSSVTAEDLWNSQRVKSLSYRHLPVAFMASCDAYPFDRERGALVELMVSQPNGGMIGAIGACRSVYMAHNRTLSNAFADAYAHATPGTTAARLLMEARNAIVFYHMNFICGANNMCFNYCGDPALPLVIPSYDIVVDDFAGGNYRTGVPVNLKAHVVSDDSPVTAFTGRALIEVYDAPITRMSLSNEAADGNPQKIVCDENLLAEYAVDIIDGVIDATVTLPQPAIEGQSFRIVLTAKDRESGLIAAGTFHGDSLAADDEITDTADPVILNFEVSPESYITEGVTTGAVRLVASILPPASGLAVGNSGVRSGIAITIDGKTRYNEVRNMVSYNDDGVAEIDFSMLNQSFGPHTATLTVSGNNGRVATATTAYTVSESVLSGVLTVDEPDPVRDSATFEIESAGQVRRLIIADSHGNTVQSVENPSMPLQWNLRDLDGKPVADGHYRAWTILESDQARGASNIVEFIVVK